MHNVKLKGAVSAIIGVLRSHIVGVSMHDARMEMELLGNESHVAHLVIENVRRRCPEVSLLLVLYFEHDAVWTDANRVRVL